MNTHPSIRLSRREGALVALFAVLGAAALFGPSVPAAMLAGSPFAHAAPAASVPNLPELLGSLPMAVVGFWGLRWLRWLDRAHEQAHDRAPVPQAVALPPIDPLDCAWMFFAGLVLAAAGSVFYHLQPDTMRLAADRAAMSVAFAGLIGFAVCERVSARAGWPAAWVTLAFGLLAAAAGQRSGNALPWALLQAGGVVLVLALAAARPVRSALGLRLGWLLPLMLLAKGFELADRAIVEATHHLLSGYGLKHLTAALAGVVVLHGSQAMGRQTLRHNPPVAVTA